MSRYEGTVEEVRKAVIKAIDYCNNGNKKGGCSENCPYACFSSFECIDYVMDDALDIIKRQQEQFDRIVEQLEEGKRLNIEAWESSNWMPNKTMYGNLAKGYEEAIEIVKGVRNE